MRAREEAVKAVSEPEKNADRHRGAKIATTMAQSHMVQVSSWC